MMAKVEAYAPSYRILIKGEELQHGANIDVLSVSVTDTMDRADSFSISLRDRHPDPKRLFAGGARLQWIDNDIFDEGNKVEIHMGYVNDLHLMMQGKIKSVSCNFLESGQPTLQVTGYSAMHDLQHRRRRQPFESATDSDIAEEIAREMGLKPAVDATKAKHSLYSPRGATFANILRERAKRLGYEVAAKNGTLIFQKPGYLTNPSPVLTLEWGRNLRSFNPRVSPHNTVSGVRVRASQTTQGRGKEALVGEAKAGDERVKMGKQTGNQVGQRVFGDHFILLDEHNIDTQDEANAVALAQLEMRTLGYISGTGSVIGNPRLRAWIMIELKGLGQRFSGKYYVVSATHTIDGSGYRTTFEVKRNAI
jgi:phage protein D